jgi:hypothetical protein
MIVAAVLAGLSGFLSFGSIAATSDRPVVIDVVSVPLNPDNPAETAIGQFRYAGGLALSSRQAPGVHGLSGLDVDGAGRLTAVGDWGVFFEARLVFDAGDHLAGISETRLKPLTGTDGRPLADTARADAEELALLPNGDRLVSFEREARIWLYPAAGGPPRRVPSPDVAFPSNLGMEALAVDPETAPDAYVVGAEGTGETWNCRVSTPSCVRGPTLDKPYEFGLVDIERLPGGMTAYLLRAYDDMRGNRSSLRIVRDATIVAEMNLAPPMTVDNFEGIAAVPRPDGSYRFYLLSDDNNRDTQRTLLLAFDWRPRDTPGR